MYQCLLLQEFLDDGNGRVCGIKTVLVNWTKDETGRWKMDEVPNSEKVSTRMFYIRIRTENSDLGCFTEMCDS